MEAEHGRNNRKNSESAVRTIDSAAVVAAVPLPA
jgi:hypothetical protein